MISCGYQKPWDVYPHFCKRGRGAVLWCATKNERERIKENTHINMDIFWIWFILMLLLYSNSSIQYTRIWRFKLGKKNNLEKGYFCVSLSKQTKNWLYFHIEYNILVKDPEIAKIAKIQRIPKCGVVEGRKVEKFCPALPW